MAADNSRTRPAEGSTTISHRSEEGDSFWDAVARSEADRIDAHKWRSLLATANARASRSRKMADLAALLNKIDASPEGGAPCLTRRP